MIKVMSKYKTKVKYVKHRTGDFGPLTSFSIGDKIKNADPEQWMNYTVTVYSDVNLKDGDEVTFTSIDSISSRVYDGKVYYDIVATIAGVEPPEELDL